MAFPRCEGCGTGPTRTRGKEAAQSHGAEEAAGFEAKRKQRGVARQRRCWQKAKALQLSQCVRQFFVKMLWFTKGQSLFHNVFKDRMISHDM